MPQKEIYGAFCTLVSLIVTFHVVQSYSRYMSGISLVYQMIGAFHESALLIATFTIKSTCTPDEKQGFLDVAVRLFSLLFGQCLAELEDVRDGVEQKALHFDLVDPHGLDANTLLMIDEAHDKPMCIYSRLLHLMLDANHRGVIAVAPPIFSRVFQEMDGGMGKYAEALKFKDAPFPMPFMAVSDLLLIVFSVYTPCQYAAWAKDPISAALFTFLSVGCMWLFHSAAQELENPFGQDQHDLNAEQLTESMNQELIALLHHAEAPVPSLADCAKTNLMKAHTDGDARKDCHGTFANAIKDARSRAAVMKQNLVEIEQDIVTLSRLADGKEALPSQEPQDQKSGVQGKAPTPDVDRLSPNLAFRSQHNAITPCLLDDSEGQQQPPANVYGDAGDRDRRAASLVNLSIRLPPANVHGDAGDGDRRAASSGNLSSRLAPGTLTARKPELPPDEGFSAAVPLQGLL